MGGGIVDFGCEGGSCGETRRMSIRERDVSTVGSMLFCLT